MKENEKENKKKKVGKLQWVGMEVKKKKERMLFSKFNFT